MQEEREESRAEKDADGLGEVGRAPGQEGQRERLEGQGAAQACQKPHKERLLVGRHGAEGREGPDQPLDAFHLLQGLGRRKSDAEQGEGCRDHELQQADRAGQEQDAPEAPLQRPVELGVDLEEGRCGLESCCHARNYTRGRATVKAQAGAMRGLRLPASATPATGTAAGRSAGEAG